MRQVGIQEYGIKQFAQAHGDGTGNDWVYHDGRYIFLDGAMCDEKCFQRWLPSADLTENRAQRRHYLVRKLEEETSRFDSFKASCLEQAQFAKQAPQHCPPPIASAVAQLERGKERIDKLRQTLADLDAEIAQDPESNLVRDQARANQHRQKCHEIDQLVSEISAVEI